VLSDSPFYLTQQHNRDTHSSSDRQRQRPMAPSTMSVWCHEEENPLRYLNGDDLTTQQPRSVVGTVFLPSSSCLISQSKAKHTATLAATHQQRSTVICHGDLWILNPTLLHESLSSCSANEKSTSLWKTTPRHRQRQHNNRDQLRTLPSSTLPFPPH
jgi:hypothetical protein